MAELLRMPEVLAGTTEAAIQSWLVAVGDEVYAGTPLAEVETEKATVTFEAEASGEVLRLLAAEGELIAVGAPVAVIGAAGEKADAVIPDATTPLQTTSAESPMPSLSLTEESAPPPEPFIEPAPAPAAVPAASGERRFASPLVRRLARERSIDLADLIGSGPGGRIVRRDLDQRLAAEQSSGSGPSFTVAESNQAVSSGVGASGAVTDVPHTGMRRAIARRLTESKSTVPHFYLVADCRVDRLLELRRQLNELSSQKISVNDFVLKAAAAAFQDVPEANAIWTDSAVRRFHTVDIAVAVAIEDRLVTPVLRGVEGLSLTAVSVTAANLAERARAGKLKQHELEGGSFAVSNLGMFGVTEFAAIISPPQSAILAVGAARPQPVVDEGKLAVATVMTVTLSADHRVLDGALAARFLAAFVHHIENPLSVLLNA